MTEEKRNFLTNSLRSVHDWFSFDLTVKLFGVTVFEYHYPPKKNSDEL